MNADGSGLQSITDTPYNKYVPRFSPDGQKICYVADEEGYTDVYVVDADGSAKRQIVQNNAENYNAIWGPDPDTLLYISNEKGPFDIYSIGIDGSGKRQLTADDHFAENLTLSPDKSKLLYAAGKIDSTVFEIYVLDLKTLAIDVLTDHMSYSRLPLWVVDGKKIAYNPDPTGDPKIFLLDMESKESINLTENATNDLLLGVCGNGRYVFYQTSGEDVHRLDMLDLEESKTLSLIDLAHP